MYSVCFYFLIFFSTIKGDLHNLADLKIKVHEVIQSSQAYIFPKNNEEFFENLKSEEVKDFGTFDFVLVGGGTAAGVLAYRLTEKQSFKVLVLEAGPADPDVAAIIGIHDYVIHNKWNWGYNSTPQKNACLSTNGLCSYHRGKVLGGSSELNGAIYVRGPRQDYNKWAKITGDLQWSYKCVLPYFKKSEDANFTQDGKYHGFNGTQGISLAPHQPGLSEAVMAGFKEMGYSNVDYNAEQQKGCSRMQLYSDYNIRSGSNYSFFRPAAERSNLNISLNSFVTKLITKGKTVTGVEFVKDGHKYFAKAYKEVIMCAGAINTPQVLMLSGIGPTDELKKHGIKIIADLPVGKYLRDHVILPSVIQLKTEKPYYKGTVDDAMDLWAKRQGPFTASVGRVVAFHDSNKDGISDVELFFQFGFVIDDGNVVVDTITPYLQVMSPKSIGEVTLKSSDPRDFPLINPNFLSHEDDYKHLYQAVKVIQDLNNTGPIKALSPAGFSVQELPGTQDCNMRCQKYSQEWWYCLFRYYASSGYHPVGTTRMGKSPRDSVVDSKLKVHGMKGLRICDAGVMPTLNRGHTNAPVVMIAEVTVDLIIEEYSRT